MRHCAKYVRAEDKFFLLWLTLTLNQSNRQKKFLIYWSGKEPRQEKYAMIEFDFLDSNFKWEYASVNIFVNGFWQKIRKRFRFLRYYENFGRVFNIWKVPIIYDKDIPAIEDWRDVLLISDVRSGRLFLLQQLFLKIFIWYRCFNPLVLQNITMYVLCWKLKKKHLYDFHISTINFDRFHKNMILFKFLL